MDHTTTMFTFRPSIRCVLIIFGLLPVAAAAQSLTVTLTGTNALCFGTSDGSITSTVTGGVPPYTYKWTTGDSTPDLNNVPAGYYNLKVTDAASAEKVEEITLTQPPSLRVNMIPFVYPNGKNISCYECYNGSIDVQVIDGTPPYSYSWDDGATTQDHSGLGAGNHNIRVDDANGCYDKVEVDLEQPERNDWTMSGNTGTNPAMQYIGTSDNKEVVFKANGQEALRLLPDGKLKVFGSLAGEGPLYRDADGTLKLGGGPTGPVLPPLPGAPCALGLGGNPYWQVGGNIFGYPLCEGVNDVPRMGTRQAHPLHLITNDVTRMLITPQGKVGIGATTNLKALSISDLNERTVLEIRSSPANASESCELWFSEGGTQRWAIGSDFSANGGQDLYIWDDVAGQNRMVINNVGKVGIGADPPENTNAPYKLYVEGGIVTRDVLVKTGNWPDYVFDEDHDLLPLPAFRAFVKKYHHLPGVPSACELEEAGGVAVGDMQRVLLKTVEEQALYILQLEERLGAMEQRLNALEATK